MKKRFLTARGLLAGAVMAAGGGAFAYWAIPASAATNPPQITTITGSAGSATVTLGHPKVAATAHLSPNAIAYAPNGDEAVAVTTGTGQAHVYLIVGSTTHNLWHVETAAGTPATYAATLVAGDAYLIAGDGPQGLVADPGATTSVTGGSTSAVATSNPITATSLAFDSRGDLLMAGLHHSTSSEGAGIQMVATTCASTCPDRYSTLTAGDLYSVAGVGMRGLGRTPAISFLAGVSGYSLAVDSQGDIFDSGNGEVQFLNEGSATLTRYGLSLPAHAATAVAGTVTTGTATCGGAGVHVPSVGSSSPNLFFADVGIDAAGNLYVTDEQAAAGKGCTWVAPASSGTLDGMSVTAGNLYALTGAGATTAFTSGAVADTTSFPNPGAVAVDANGNVLVALNGTAPALRVIAEKTGTFYHQTMVVGHAYLIAGGSSASRTTTPGNATGFKFAGSPVSTAAEPFGIASMANGATGDLLLTDASTATTSSAYQITGLPAPITPTVTSVAPSSGTTAGSTHVTITGTNLTGVTVVKFGGDTVTAIVDVSSTSVTAHTPAHAAGAVTVFVTGADGTGSKADAYTYATPTTPTVTLTVSPTSSAYYGTPVTLTAHVTPSAAGTVQFKDGTTVLATKIVSGGTATYTTSALAKGAHSFTATFTPSGTLYIGSTSTPAVTYTVTTAPSTRVYQTFQLTVHQGHLTVSCHTTTTVKTWVATQATATNCELIHFASVTLNGNKQTDTDPMNTVYVYTARGDDTSGWSLTAFMVSSTHNAANGNHTCSVYSTFCNSTGGSHVTLATGHARIPKATLKLTGFTCTKPVTNTNPAPTCGTGGTFGGTPLALSSATAGQSQGEWDVTAGTYTLTIPATILFGTYYGTVEYLLTSTT